MRKTISLITSCAFLISANPIRADTELFSCDYASGEQVDIGALLGDKLSSGMTMNEAAEFIKCIIDEAEAKYGIRIDLAQVLDLAIDQLSIIPELTKEDIEFVKEYYAQLLEKCGYVTQDFWLKKKKKHPEGDLELPNNLAIGYSLMLAGALLCILPTGITQGLGTGIASTGLGFVLNGLNNGEKPYYTDPNSGAPIYNPPILD